MRGGLGEVEAGRRVLDHRLDLRQAGERLDARLRLARLARLVAEAVDERLDMARARRRCARRARACCMARSVRMRTNSSKPPGVTVMLAAVEDARSPATARSSSPRSWLRPAARRRGSGRARPPATAWPPGRGGWSARRAAAGRARRTARWRAPRASASRRRIRQPGAPAPPRRSPGRRGWRRRGQGRHRRRSRAGVRGSRRAGAVGRCSASASRASALGVALQHGVQQASRSPAGASCATVRDARRGRRGGCRRRPAAARRRSRAAGWTCRRRCGRPGRCGGPGPP